MAKNIFNSIQVKKPKANYFDLTHDVKTSCNMGELIPILCLDCVPGDRFNIGAQSLIRFQPMVAPVMHRFDVTIHYFAVPKRILWSNWEKFITNTPDPVTGLLPAVPYINVNSGTHQRLHDYFFIPAPGAFDNGTDVNVMPFAAYQLVWKEWYRAQYLQDDIDIELVDGDNSANTELTTLRRRCWEHDYFTAALPFAQKGAAVNIPIGNFNDVPVWLNSETSGSTTVEGTPDDIVVGKRESADSLDPIQLGQLYAETSSLEAGSAQITDLRRAFRLQEWLELAARAGSRYVENILAFFGVRSSDQRLQRPEYITGVKSPVVISEVLNTSNTAEAPQGNMSGHAVSVIGGKSGSYFCEEHMYIIGVMSVMPKPAYMNGIPKHFLKLTDPFEHFWPQFAHIGEQAITNEEIKAYEAPAIAKATFGYVPRYSEYKFHPNMVSGEMRTNLDFWHAARKFNTLPTLSAEFVEMNNEEVDRIFAVEDPFIQKIIIQVLNQISAVRPMPKFGNPML